MHYYESAYPVLASTDGVAYEIYLSGCRGYCPGCHSPHTHDFSVGLDLNDSTIMTKLIENIRTKYNKGLIDNLVIIGGEPLDNPDEELLSFIQLLRSEFPKCKLWLYTHFERSEVELSHKAVLDALDYVKCGMFDQSKYSDQGFKDPLTGVLLATSNQYFIKGGYGGK